MVRAARTLPGIPVTPAQKDCQVMDTPMPETSHGDLRQLLLALNLKTTMSWRDLLKQATHGLYAGWVIRSEGQHCHLQSVCPGPGSI